MFSDIEGFTSISESVVPSMLIRVLEEYFNNCTEMYCRKLFEFGVCGSYVLLSLPQH